MTDAEKLADYDRLVELLQRPDQPRKNTYRERKASSRSNPVRAHDAYLEVVKLIIGVNVLH